MYYYQKPWCVIASTLSLSLSLSLYTVVYINIFDYTRGGGCGDFFFRIYRKNLETFSFIDEEYIKRTIGVTQPAAAVWSIFYKLAANSHIRKWIQGKVQ